MKSSNLDWKAFGERWLEKVPCEKCEGHGETTSSEEEDCQKCSGNGHTESPAEGHVLCPECKGMRRVRTRKVEQCSECDGFGYRPKIMQEFQATTECPECEGSGEVEKEDEDEEETCPGCGGKGHPRCDGVVPISEWKGSPWAEEVVGSEFTPDPFERDKEYYLKSGAIALVSDCDDCDERSIDECESCAGTGRTVGIFPPCEECGETGVVHPVYLYTCDNCLGTGELRLTENREV